MVLIGRARGIRRQIAALTGALAILFQAVLFAWHHHPPPFYARGSAGATTLAAPTAPVTPASADHDCQICFTLCHHGALPVDFFAAKPPEEASLRQIRVATAEVLLAPYLLFRSRAPPSA